MIRPGYKTKFPPRQQKAGLSVDLSQVYFMTQEIVALRQKIEKEHAQFLDRAKKDIDAQNSQNMARNMRNIEKMEAQLTRLLGEHEAKLKRLQETMKKGERGDTGEKGEKGESGETPSDQKIVALIKPLIPTTLPVSNEGHIVDRAIDKIKNSGVIPTVSDLGKLLITMFENNYFKKIWKEIESIRTELRSVASKTMLGGGGGGMGTIKYFKFSCDGVTTTFTLPDTPTQEGAAVFPRYQGQSLYPTDHFTVSGKTLTTVFTGESNTFIDGFLIT